jgi:hypothetical protein
MDRYPLLHVPVETLNRLCHPEDDTEPAALAAE